MTHTPTGCPAWCAGHDTGARTHRRGVGAVEVDGRAVCVVIVQSPGGEPSLAVSGSGLYVQIQVDDHRDAASLFSRLGRADLAELIDEAARLVEAS